MQLVQIVRGVLAVVMSIYVFVPSKHDVFILGFRLYGMLSITPFHLSPR